MDKIQTITRRSVLSGLTLAAVAASLPALARQALPASPIPAMIEAHQAARLELTQANAAADPVYDAFHAANTTDPILVQLPGFRFGHGLVSVTRTSPDAIRERYAEHYGIFSGKSGVTFKSGAWTAEDYAADQERDLNLALANYDAATAKLKDRARRVGLMAAEQRLDDACEAMEAAWMALLSYVPRNLPELREKAAAVLAIVVADPVQLDDDHAEILLRSLVEEA
jgi:hypothetical protein